MSEALLLRGMRAIDPSRALDSVVDIFVERGVISRLGKDAGRDKLAELNITRDAGSSALDAIELLSTFSTVRCAACSS